MLLLNQFMYTLKNFFNLYRLPILSGILIGTSYIPFPPWALLFCYAPLWLWTLKSKASFKQIFIAGWITQFILTLIGFHWVAFTAYEFGHMPWPVAIIILFLFCSLVHLHIPISLLIWRKLEKFLPNSLWQKIFALAVITIIIELLWPKIFPWHLGYPWLWAKLPAAQFADIIGFDGLAALSLLTNGWLLYLWLNRKSVLKHALIMFVIFIALNIYGLWAPQKWKKTDQTLHVLQVQGNIGNFEKLAAEEGGTFRTTVIQKFIELTKQGLQNHPETELILWPETAFPDYLNNYYQNYRYQILLSRFQKEHGKLLLTGAYAKDPPNKSKFDYERLSYNGLFLLDGQGELAVEPYYKTILLAFGEYLPLSELYPKIRDWLPMIANFGRGNGPTVFQFGEHRWGLQICYEGLYPSVTRALSNKGAQIIFNVTNDSWFGKYFEPYQHLYMTLARAIETRRPLVRNTNTGISTAILADGTIMEKSPLLTEWVGINVIPYLQNPPQTFYVRFGFYWPWFLILIWLMGVFYYRRRI